MNHSFGSLWKLYFWSYSNSTKLRILGKFMYTRIIPTPHGSVLCVSLCEKHKEENAQTWNTCLMWTMEVPGPEPFGCALKTRVEACKNKITNWFTTQMQKERDSSPQDAPIISSQWTILSGSLLCSRCYATKESSDQKGHLPFLGEPLWSFSGPVCKRGAVGNHSYHFTVLTAYVKARCNVL